MNFNLFNQEFNPNMCASKFGLETSEQLSELTVPRRNIFAQTNYDEVDFFTNKSSLEIFEEKTGGLERDSYSLNKTEGISDFIAGDKNGLHSCNETNCASCDDSISDNIGSDWLQTSPSF